MILPMNKKTQQGFTLIELLVVIAIIGILAAMVITNLRTARLKATDANAIGSMSSARGEAELYYDTNSLSFDSLCADDGFNRLLDGANKSNSTGPICFDEITNYIAAVQLSTNSGGYFCIDSSGAAMKISTAPSGSSESCEDLI